MTEQEMSNVGWNPCYTTVCIRLDGKIVQSGDKEIMMKFAKEHNYIVAEIKIINFEKDKKEV